jgi:hypothetical protein
MTFQVIFRPANEATAENLVDKSRDAGGDQVSCLKESVSINLVGQVVNLRRVGKPLVERD